MSLRVLTVDPGVDFSVSDVHNGLIAGLKANGATVSNFATSDRLGLLGTAWVPDPGADGGQRQMFKSLEQCVAVANEMLRGAVYAFKPDLVVVTSGFFVDEVTLKVMRARGQKVVMVMTEQPYELDRELWLAGEVDYVALNDPTHMDLFRERCSNVWYRPHAFDPAVHHPNGRVDEFDAVWIGTAYASRLAFMECVDFGNADVKLGGNFKDLAQDSQLRRFLIDQSDDEACVDNADTAAWFRRAAATWNNYRKEAHATDTVADLGGWAMGPREVEAAACGCFMARESRPEGDELFPMLPIIDTPEELSDVLAWSMANPDARRDAALKACEAVADRTFDRSAAELLSRCGF